MVLLRQAEWHFTSIRFFVDRVVSLLAVCIERNKGRQDTQRTQRSERYIASAVIYTQGRATQKIRERLVCRSLPHSDHLVFSENYA